MSVCVMKQTRLDGYIYLHACAKGQFQTSLQFQKGQRSLECNTRFPLENRPESRESARNLCLKPDEIAKN